jgi:two-component sensor histidine kinase
MAVERVMEQALAPDAKRDIQIECRVCLPDRSWRWVALHGAVLSRDMETSAALSARGVIQDVTERKLAEERHRVLAWEVDHRAKNALAVVLAAVRLTTKTDMAAYAEAIEGRVAAMARTHNLLAAARWTGADLQTLVQAELNPFLQPRQPLPGESAPPRAEVSGPALMLDPEAAQAISMVLHELASNAIHHGALAVPGGLVRLSWHMDDEDRLLHLRWAETDGPSIPEPPLHRGFGSQVVEAIVDGQLEGKMQRNWEPSGLICEIVLPLKRILSTTGDKRAR